MPEKITKTIRQYSKVISPEDMEKLAAIAKDYAAVKNYVYGRYSGVKSLPKLYPGYTIQNELTKSGLRSQLGLPSIYFYLAMFDALGDIKAGWKQLRRKISKNAMKNENFTKEEKRYVCYMLKSDQHFSAVVNRRDFVFPDSLAGLEESSGRLNNYICRQVRKYRLTHHSNKTNIFSVSPKGYIYENGGIRLTTKVPRQRVFIPLTDNNQYDRQLVIELKANRLVLYVPIDTKIKKHPDYVNEIGIAWGYFVMFTTSTGNQYGAEYGQRRSQQVQQMNETNAAHQRMLQIYNQHIAKGNLQKANNIQMNNLGRQKYDRKKYKNNQAIKTYINAQINRMLRTEKPAVIYVPKLPPSFGSGHVKAVNANITAWQRGYIKERLAFKCKIHGIALKEVKGAGIGQECGFCGKTGVKKGESFICHSCGKIVNGKMNIAMVVLNRGKQ